MDFKAHCPILDYMQCIIWDEYKLRGLTGCARIKTNVIKHQICLDHNFPVSIFTKRTFAILKYLANIQVVPIDIRIAIGRGIQSQGNLIDTITILIIHFDSSWIPLRVIVVQHSIIIMVTKIPGQMNTIF